MWGRKTKINSDEYDVLLKRISELSSELSALKNKFINFETQVHNLRGQFNRKLSGLKEEEFEETEKDKYEDGLDMFRL